MYFEGSEKKIELIARGAALRARPENFWRQVCELAGAKILSQIKNDACTAYLLSESSLFVWDDRLTMLTCGRTTLVRAAAFLLEVLRPENVEMFTYERKNEYFPHQQETDFYKDLGLLREKVVGRAFRFGYTDEHHLLLYHMNKPYLPSDSDCTLEVLMYNMEGSAREIFKSGQTLERMRELTRLEGIFPDFTIDDHLFKPCGYSLNALRGAEYFTIHVSPEETGSYLSFETNVRLGEKAGQVLRGIVEVFQPRSFDVVYFHPDSGHAPFEMAPFVRRGYVRQMLSCGFEVGYATYYRGLTRPLPAVPLEAEA